ncbi:hypothetical protein [Pseudotabrizicola algicola]|uniref:PhnA-like protein n=1 Tax=Pseudotabrizicola algicola TaxID=2709381 RepID=A0A6B3RTS2_9RHOB|nr:hypothetical protein [Pseudotabrizicola algicola]NEX46482.1 hypothetical protein [Pseudotabrizicola algicola]
MEPRKHVTETETNAAASAPYVDWAAIFAGAVIAVALGVLFTGFGAALGLTAVSAERGEGNGLVGFVISTLFIIVSMVAAYAAGGYIAGRLRRRTGTATRDETTVRDGLNGLVVWGLGVATSALMLGSVVSGLAAGAGNVASAGAQVAGSVAAGAADVAADATQAALPEESIAFEARALLRPQTLAPGAAGASSTTADVTAILANIVTTGELSDANRAYLVEVTSARTGLAPQEVEARVEEAVAAAQAARNDAAQLADEAETAARDAAETARISAILTAFLLTATALVAGVASYVAAVKGGRHRDEGRVFSGFSYLG